MNMPSFSEYLDTINPHDMQVIEERLQRNLSVLTPHMDGGVEDTIVALSTAISLEFLAHYHGWLSLHLEELPAWRADP